MGREALHRRREGWRPRSAATLFMRQWRIIMFRCSSGSRAGALALIIVALSAAQAFAHCFVGPRFLPATLATDDPCVADEMSLPTVSWSRTADVPPANQWDVSGELSKRITEDFGVSIGTTWTQIRGPGGLTMAGFDNIETAAQYQLLKNGSHQPAVFVRLGMDCGSTCPLHSRISPPYR